MDFSLTEQQLKVKENAREFALKEIAPLAAGMDKSGLFNKQLYEKIAQAGFMKHSVAKEWGGYGDGVLERLLVVEEFSKICAATAGNYMFGGLGTIKSYGSDELKKRFMPDILSGKKACAYVLTEPNAGSDVSAASTTIKSDGDDYVINGRKSLIATGKSAELLVVYGITDKTVPVTKGMSVVVVERDKCPGIKVIKVDDRIGLRACETAEIEFDNVRVPKANLVGEEGKGFKYAMVTIDGGRINVTAQALGIAERALEESVKYLKTRVQFGKPIAAQQGLQWYIADMETDIEAARALMYECAYLYGTPEFPKMVAIAKYFASEMCVRACDRALQIHGGVGTTKEYVVERLYRDANSLRIFDGTSEIHRMVIAKHVLG